jgi:hypothetical protein
MNPTRPAGGPPPPRGAALIGAVILAVAVAGLAYGLVADARSAEQHVERAESSYRALEMAEIGLCRVESSLVEGMIRELKRAAGTYTGPSLWTTEDDGTNPPFLQVVLPETAYGNGTYQVRATCPVTDPQHQHYARRWTVRSHGRWRWADGAQAAQRWLEAGYWLRPESAFVDGLLALEEMEIGGTVTTDSYDSESGTYASQVDPVTGIADFGGSVGSNTSYIEGNGTIVVNGDAIPGPDDEVTLIGGATVTGETEPRNEERTFSPTPIGEFQAAYNEFSGGTYDRTTKTYSVGGTAKIIADSGVSVNDPSGRYFDFRFSGTGTVTFTGGTYFFNTLDVSGGITMKFTGTEPTKIYITEALNAGAATFINATPGQVPANVQIYAHPYPIPMAPRLPGSSTEWTPEVKLAGGPDSAWVLYGPEAKLTLTGGSDFFGAAVSRWIDIQGTAEYHYDRALDWKLLPGVPRLERRYWREIGQDGAPMDVKR